MPLSPDLPPAPQDGAPVNAMFESAQTLHLMALRRSIKIAHLGGAGPDQAQLAALLRLAARSPDHGKLAPWRFLVIAGEARARAGAAVAAAMGAESGAAFAGMFQRAPLCVAVISTAQPHPKIPEWEQVLSAAAVCYGLLISAHAMGFAGCWLTELPAYDPAARAALGLAAHERITGFIYLGTALEPATERTRKDVASLTAWF